jgi:hypothetical protein
MKKYSFILVLIFLTYVSPAQSSDRSKDKMYANNPVWIQMMDDPNVNYFEIDRAFKTYFEHHEMPEGENEVIGESWEQERIPSKRKQRKITIENKMRFAVKKYQLWREQMKPFVKADGSVMSSKERLDIWRKQK